MWSKEETCKLIELYREYSVLWDPSCTDEEQIKKKNNGCVEPNKEFVGHHPG